MIRIAVIDDDATELALLCEHLQFISGELHTPFEIDRFLSGSDFLQGYQGQYDLLCLDIDMPECDGMQIAEEIRKTDEEVLIMFVTHMAQMAIRGYDVQAVDFVLKPVNRYSLLLKMQRILKSLKQRSDTEVIIQTVEGQMVVSSRDIFYIEVSGHYLTYHTGEGTFTEKASLSNREEELAGVHFQRCNNCYLVNLRHVHAVNKDDIQVGDEWLKVSRSRKKAFLQALTGYIEGGNC